MLRSNFVQSDNSLQFSYMANSSKALQRSPLSMPKKKLYSQKLVKAEIIADIAKLFSNDNIRTFGPAIGTIGTILTAANRQNNQTNNLINHLEKSLNETMNYKFKEVHDKFGELEKKIDVRFSKVDDKFSELEKKIDDKFGKSEEKVDNRFNKIDDRLIKIDEKIY